MSNNTTIARPYATALFEHAFAANKPGLWSDVLFNLAVAVSDENGLQFLLNPAVSEKQQIELLMTLFSKLESEEVAVIKNMIALLAHNKRLPLLAEIKVLYEALRAEQEKTLDVKVTSYSELSAEQQTKLVSSLCNRLKRQVTLNLNVDKSLLGGVIIHAGDLVIDGSVRGKLNKLSADLAA